MCTYRTILRSLIISFHEGDKEAGQVLINISMQNASSCCAIWEENGHSIFCKLMEDLQDGSYQQAVELAENLVEYLPSECNTIHEILNKNLCMVLQKIMIGKVHDVHFIVGLTSRICAVVPRIFVANIIDPEAFVGKLVRGLHNHPTREYPRIRRVFLEMAISLLKADPCYASIFEKQNMLEAIEVVGNSKCNIEKYRVLSHGNAILDKGPSMSQLLQEAKVLIKDRSDPGPQGN